MIGNVWESFRALGLATQLWVTLVLVPVNLASAWFIGQPGAAVIAALAIGGMIPNLVLLLIERGFSKAMALSHLVFWIPLVALIALAPEPQITAPYAAYLWLLLAVNLISLAFDATDAIAWWRGDRAIARRR